MNHTHNHTNIKTNHKENNTSRNLSSLRVDKITKYAHEKTKDLPNQSHLHITLLVSNENEAYLGGLALARAFPSFDRKTEEKHKNTLHVTCSFQGLAKELDTTLLSQLCDSIRVCCHLMGTIWSCLFFVSM